MNWEVVRKFFSSKALLEVRKFFSLKELGSGSKKIQFENIWKKFKAQFKEELRKGGKFKVGKKEKEFAFIGFSEA